MKKSLKGVLFLFALLLVLLVPIRGKAFTKLQTPGSGDYEISCSMEQYETDDIYPVISESERPHSKTVTKYIAIDEKGVSISDSGYTYPESNISIDEISSKDGTVTVKSTISHKLEAKKKYQICFTLSQNSGDDCCLIPEAQFIIDNENIQTSGTYEAKLEVSPYFKSGYYYVVVDVFELKDEGYTIIGSRNPILSANVRKYFYQNENGQIKVYDKQSQATNISAAEKIIKVGKQAKIRIDNSNSKKIVWSVSNDKAIITKKNKKSVKIKGVKKGKCILKARVKGKTYKCKIIIK